MKKCPNCGTQLNDDVLFCTECGNQIPQGNVCPHCGASVNEGNVFCENCGAKLDEVPSSIPTESTQKKCPYCGASVNDGNVFCENCGKNLADGSIDFTSNNIQQQPYTIEEKTSNNMKMIIPILIGIISITIIGGGWWYWKSGQSPKEMTSVENKESVNNEAVDSIEVCDIHSADYIKQYLDEILPLAIKMDEKDALSRYFSKDFERLFKKVDKYDRENLEEGDIGFWDFSFWTDGQDGELCDTKVVKIENLSSNKATAIVQFTIKYGDYDESKESTQFEMIFENSQWRIDDFHNYKWRFSDYMNQTKEKNVDIQEIDTTTISMSY